MRTLAQVDADLVNAYASRTKAMEAAEYSIDSGQGRQSVKRDLGAINKTIDMLESERAQIAGEAGYSISVVVDRGAM